MLSSKDICPICEEGTLTEIIEDMIYFESKHSVCSHCGAEQTNAVQLKHNKEGMQKFLKTVDKR